jgi:hypothetical protein
MWYTRGRSGGCGPRRRSGAPPPHAARLLRLGGLPRGRRRVRHVASPNQARAFRGRWLLGASGLREAQKNAAARLTHSPLAKYGLFLSARTSNKKGALQVKQQHLVRSSSSSSSLARVNRKPQLRGICGPGTRARTNTNLNGTEANAADRSARTCGARESKRKREREFA